MYQMIRIILKEKAQEPTDKMFILFTGIMMMIMTNLHLGTHGLICHQPNKQRIPILQQTTQNQQEVWNSVKGPLMLICLPMVAMQPLPQT